MVPHDSHYDMAVIMKKMEGLGEGESRGRFQTLPSSV